MAQPSELKEIESKLQLLAHKNLKTAQELVLLDPTATSILGLQLAELEIKILERKEHSEPFADLAAQLDDLREKWDLVAPVEYERDLIAEKGSEHELKAFELQKLFAQPWIDGEAAAELEGLKGRARAHGRLAEEAEYQKLLATRCGTGGLLRKPVRRNQNDKVSDRALQEILGPDSQSQAGIEKSSSREEAARRRGRRPDQRRRAAIHNAIIKHSDGWRDYLGDIFKELDANDVPLGDFQEMEIHLNDDARTKVWKWDDLDLASGEQRKRIIDALRKYVD